MNKLTAPSFQEAIEIVCESYCHICREPLFNTIIHQCQHDCHASQDDGCAYKQFHREE